MNMKTELTNVQALYIDNRLADMYDVLDQLHSAASEGQWQLMTTMSKRELLSLLNDLIYTAQETSIPCIPLLYLICTEMSSKRWTDMPITTVWGRCGPSC